MPTAKARLHLGPTTERVAAQNTLPPSTTVPVRDEWQTTFPVGFYCNPSAIDARDPAASTTTTADLSNLAGQQVALFHPDSGMIRLGMGYQFWSSGVPAVQVDSLHMFDTLDTYKLIKLAPGIQGRTDASPGTTGLDIQWRNNSAVTTYAQALAIATPVVARYVNNPSIIAYNFADDVTLNNTSFDGVNSNGAKAATMMKAIQDLDTFGRPAPFTCTDPLVWELIADADLKVVFTYRYATGNVSDAVDPANPNTAEGDFHRGSFSGILDFGGGGNDWVDALREWFTTLPTTTHIWLALGTHSTETVPAGPTMVRRPSQRELRKMFWIAVGESVKGIFWFTYDGSVATPAPDIGVGSASRAADLGVISELSHRLSPNIRERLLNCNRVTGTQPFTATGGGRTGLNTQNYPNAYLSTLQDNRTGEYLIVVCSHSLSTQSSVTINDNAPGTRPGWLENLETGVRIRVGETWSLPALDGTIFRYVPQLGVPTIDPDYSVDVETWWASHPYNPAAAATKYIASGAIQTHARVINVAIGDDLQAKLDANPGDNITFLLADHYVSNETVNVVERNGIHFVSATAVGAGRAILRRVYIWGNRHILWYNGTRYGTPPGYPGMVEADASVLPRNDPVWGSGGNNFIEEAIYAWENPKRDFLFRDIDFVSDTIAALYAIYHVAGNAQTVPTPLPAGHPVWSRNHWAPGAPIWTRNTRDGMVERCTFSGYQQYLDEDATGDIIPDVEATTTGIPAQFHNGLVGGNGGITNWCVRECTLTPAADSRGWPAGVFFDGARGCIVEDNTFASNGGTQKWQQESILGLTNDDYTADMDRDGRFSVEHDNRSARYWVVANNAFGNASTCFAVTGWKNLFTGNTITMVGSAIGHIVNIDGRCSRQDPKGHIYDFYGNVISNNTVTATSIAEFVALGPDGTWGNCVGSAGQSTAQKIAYAYRGKLGNTTVKNNTLNGAGAVTAWLRDTTPPYGSAQQPGVTDTSGDLVCGNNKNDAVPRGAAACP